MGLEGGDRLWRGGLERLDSGPERADDRVRAGHGVRAGGCQDGQADGRVFVEEAAQVGEHEVSLAVEPYVPLVQVPPHVLDREVAREIAARRASEGLGQDTGLRGDRVCGQADRLDQVAGQDYRIERLREAGVRFL